MGENINILVQINSISEDDLYLVEKDLSFQEKGSLAFLLFGDNKANAEVMVQKLLISYRNKDNVSDILTHYSNQHSAWKEFLVEALAIVRANKVLRKLGLKLAEVRNYFLPHIKEMSTHINPVLKVLYFICDQLTPVQAADLVLKIEENEGSENHLRFYNSEYLEVFLLKWIGSGRLVVGDPGTTDVSLLALYFKHNEMNSFLGMLSVMSKSILSPIHDIKGDTAERRETNENNLILDKVKSLEIEDKDNRTHTSEEQPRAICYGPTRAEIRNVYEIDRQAAGFILIINQRTFYRSDDPNLQDQLPANNLSEREGTDFDRNRLSSTFSSRGYQPIIREDLDHLEVLQEIREAVKRSIIYYSLVVCILSHGEEGCVYGSDSIPVEISAIKDILTQLETKPKLLFIQACQGSVVQKRQECLEFDGDHKTYRNYSDMLVANSAIPGYASLRDRNSGSWFIQTLCDKIDELADEEDIMGILTAVNAAIHMKKGPNNIRMTPILQSTLRKKFRLPSQ